jgi:hypothetical protein
MPLTAFELRRRIGKNECIIVSVNLTCAVAAIRKRTTAQAIARHHLAANALDRNHAPLGLEGFPDAPLLFEFAESASGAVFFPRFFE